MIFWTFGAIFLNQNYQNGKIVRVAIGALLFRKHNPPCSIFSPPYHYHTTPSTMHPLVRDLYKRVLHVGRDYPTGLAHVKQVWKTALRNPDNCPSCVTDPTSSACEEEILRAVYKGRFMVKEMVGVIQIKKYRAMKARYGSDRTREDPVVQKAMYRLEKGDLKE